MVGKATHYFISIQKFCLRTPKLSILCLLVILPDVIYRLLVNYYNNAYELEFMFISDLVDSKLFNQTNRPIIVLLNIYQFDRIRISAEVFSSTLAFRYVKNSHILAKFIQKNNFMDVFPGQV